MNIHYLYHGLSKDPDGVYRLSFFRIEAFFEALLKKYHPEILDHPQQVPIDLWIENGEFGCSLEYADLAFPQAKGFTSYGKGIAFYKD